VLAAGDASAEGLQLGFLLTLRFAGACAGCMACAPHGAGEHAADLAARWLAPLEHVRVPVREARAMLGLSMRFGPLLRRRGRAHRARAGPARRASAARGARWLAAQARRAVPTLVGALERAERVALALEARHYQLRPAAVASAPAQVAPGAGRAGRVGGRDGDRRAGAGVAA
jgi:energy-coupling factor transporter transmembrane protein EcfT